MLDIPLTKIRKTPDTWWGWVDILARENIRLFKNRPDKPALTYLTSQREIVKHLVYSFKEGLKVHYPEVEVALVGSAALWVAGIRPTFADFDIFSNLQLSPKQFTDITGYKVDRITRIGLQHWNLNFDFFFNDIGNVEDTIKLGCQHIIQIDGIYIQDPTFIQQYNYVLNETDPSVHKPRITQKPPDELYEQLKKTFKFERRRPF